MTKTYKEECYMRGLFDEEDELDISFKEMKNHNIVPASIPQMAHQMLIQEMAPLSSLECKIERPRL